MAGYPSAEFLATLKIMKAALQLKISASLTLAPQMQQAVKLLQLSGLELQEEIQQALESNMMLELAEDNQGNGEADPDARAADDAALESDTLMKTDGIPEELPVDTAWEDIYDGGGGYSRRTGEAVNHNGFENWNARTATLREHLLSQLNLVPSTESDAAIAVAIIDAVNEDGYLSCGLEEISATIGDDHGAIAMEKMETILHLIQAMEPVGVAARNLAECLLIQLNQCPSDTPWLNEAKRLVSEHLHLLASHNYPRLRRRMKLDQGQLKQVVNLIQLMNPRPGGQIDATPIDYIVPDIYVKKRDGAWRVDLNSATMPNLRINGQYANMIKRSDNSSENTSLKTHLQEARWLIKNLQSRSETLLKVAARIVEKQRAFLEYGEEAMKPLVLHDIAAALDLHETTISRVTTKKYMHTPRGIFELKYFFSSHVDTDLGGTCSSTAVRARIKKLIQSENIQSPLSDGKIAAILSEQGINVARRTVAKYRETMTIPPSNERKRLI